MATLDEIQAALEGENYRVEKIDDQTLRICDADDGIEAILAKTDTEILVQATLVPVAAVKDPAKVNERILRTHKYIPLTTVAIETIGGQDCYVAFGSLAAESQLPVIVKEVDFLYANLDDIADLFTEDGEE